VPLVVIYDACVLFPAPLRDLLLRLAERGLVQARWSEEILDECFRNILTKRADLSMKALNRTRMLMNTALPDALVTDYEKLAQGIELPDPNDRHVVAAAMKADARVIVTFNLRDFPDRTLSAVQIEAQHPDKFIFNLLSLNDAPVAAVIREQAADLKNPRRTTGELLDILRAQGLPKSMQKLQELLTIQPVED
jgi:predicted nucleic acid-binding protein